MVGGFLFRRLAGGPFRVFRHLRVYRFARSCKYRVLYVNSCNSFHSEGLHMSVCANVFILYTGEFITVSRESGFEHL